MAWDDVKNFLGQALGDVSLFLRPASTWGEIPEIIEKRHEEAATPAARQSLLGSPFRAGLLGVGGKDVGGRFQPDIPETTAQNVLQPVHDPQGNPIPGVYMGPDGKLFKGGLTFPEVVEQAKKIDPNLDLSHYRLTGMQGGGVRMEVAPGPLPPPPEGMVPKGARLDPKRNQYIPYYGLPGADKGPTAIPPDQLPFSTDETPPGDTGAISPQALTDGLVQRGFTRPQAGAIAANAHVESALYPGNVNKTGGDSGLLQWTGPRLAGLQNFAKQSGRDWRDPNVQMDWIALEHSGGSTKYGGSDESGNYAAAFQGRTPGQMGARFGQYVERPQDLAATVDQRTAYAEQYARGPSGEAAEQPPVTPGAARPGGSRLGPTGGETAGALPPVGAAARKPTREEWLRQPGHHITQGPGGVRSYTEASPSAHQTELDAWRAEHQGEPIENFETWRAAVAGNIATARSEAAAIIKDRYRLLPPAAQQQLQNLYMLRNAITDMEASLQDPAVLADRGVLEGRIKSSALHYGFTLGEGENAYQMLQREMEIAAAKPFLQGGRGAKYWIDRITAMAPKPGDQGDVIQSKLHQLNALTDEMEAGTKKAAQQRVFPGQVPGEGGPEATPTTTAPATGAGTQRTLSSGKVITEEP